MIAAQATPVLAPFARRDATVVESGDPTVLAQLVDGRAGLAIWTRPFAEDTAAELAALDAAALPSVAFEADAGDIGAMLADGARAVPIPPPVARVFEDAADLARRFAALTGAERVFTKLEMVANDACGRLHQDEVAQRMIVTYRGPGTQWLPPEHEAALGGERRAVPPGLLRSVPVFAVALFAGLLGGGGRAILHRSPPIAGTGAARLALTINEALGHDEDDVADALAGRRRAVAA